MESRTKKPKTCACVPTAVVILPNASHVSGYGLLVIRLLLGAGVPSQAKLTSPQSGGVCWCLLKLSNGFTASTSPQQHYVNGKESNQQLLYSPPDIQLFPITIAGLIFLLLIMVKSWLWVASPVLKMRGNKRYITLTDESQNATLTLRMSDRS